MTKNRVEAVDRALSIVGAFANGPSRLNLRDLAEKTGLYKSTILRLCGSLEHFGYLVRDEHGAFRLGPTIGQLGSLYRRELGDLIRPSLRQLAEELNETASFYVREGDVRVCLLRQNSNQEIRHHLEEGVRLPLQRGAAGQVLLAFAGEQGEVMDLIRQRGYHLSLGERAPDVAAIAVPLCLPDGSLRGALSVSGLKSRFDEAFQARAVERLKEEAIRLTRQIANE
ncbi:IclR family transcriptional regulator [Phytopseudomonas dryadis]|uniref:IclR family transcriptional regulator n=1 Tax=Phytopseudomonas dryadis TaxID=2487520 RepID=A0ABY1Z3B3_9GAMM|nr:MULTISPECIES: IclR family transcriptional regulator [Pseudomonas]TBV03014.1 IclR family transcriptional regulator [Pseudomonas dryadis]TBV17710.1 IclR family transcriptional regulator [Pseudomonas sp. FRB 230]